jgi:hypothetical protein
MNTANDVDAVKELPATPRRALATGRAGAGPFPCRDATSWSVATKSSAHSRVLAWEVGASPLLTVYVSAGLPLAGRGPMKLPARRDC